ncbi:GntR family transcriptional regulator [Sphingobacterium alkalisoli]|uniref:GntR family transcriptional regulator n=1 Tax=Sphingobacterium alkalisoli TaxID=1874115 RepID=A0A4U0H9A5_9SPHI|nr:GntR family transcriptional regulator [Sphingobacterium alkalisoli]TJY68475.1 GntR family transcriptional regulator [Sphingobacterium alkalisoli]GGH06259.1 transcriptional regulator [Sphingobacterium alkalisoli]
MSSVDLIKYIQISDFSSTPKYLQLADAVIDAIKNKLIGVGDMLPSINELSMHLDISRDTVEKGYKLLKNQDIIASTPGKGYFIAKADIRSRQKIALFLNKLSAHKKIVYDAFAKELGDDASLDMFVYNSDISYLRSLLLNLTKQYDRYVVFPHFKEGRDQAPDVLALIPAEKLMLLGRMVDGMEGDFPAVYENYEKDIYQALEIALDPLSKYRMLKLVFPDNSDYPKAIIKGFYKFCQQYAFDHSLVGDLSKENIKNGECYINLAEDDLVILVDKIISKGLKIGTDIGIISYNETPLKKFILNGITTISTDFELMGKYAAQIIKENSNNHVEVPFYVNLRASI